MRACRTAIYKQPLEEKRAGRAILPDVEASNRVIGFASDLVPLITSGNKTYTYRLGSKFSSVMVGQELLAADEYGEIFGKLKILEKTVTAFGRLPLRRAGHEEYLSKKHQIETFTKYYARTPSEAEPATVLRFVFVKDGHRST